MEIEGCWEKETLVHELCQGMEMAKQLKFVLDSPVVAGSIESQQFLLQAVMDSFEKMLMILNWNGGSIIEQQPHSLAIVSNVSDSSLSRDGSPLSENCDAVFKENQANTPKKRKLMPTWTDKVRVSSDNGFEGPIDDGNSWRKYGQKDILGAKFPRSYYRCTYRNTQNCWATKQVQRSDDDPTVFEIIYRGKHNCNQNTSPKKQEPKQKQKQNNSQPQQSNKNSLLLNFQTNLTVETKCIEEKETQFTFPYPSFGWYGNKTESSSPTFEGNFDFYLTQGGADFNEIISTNTSATNSPILDLDFTIDPDHFDPGFPFDAHTLFN